MKTKIAAWFLLTMLITGGCSSHSWKKDADGITISLPGNGEYEPHLVRLTVETPSVIKVSASPESEFTDDTSLVAIIQPSEVRWTAEETNGNIYLNTEVLKVKVNSKTGALTFMDHEGNILLEEPETGGKRFTAAPDEGYYGIQQVFETSADEGLYGLGQQQNGEMNLKGKDIDLYQFNIVAVNPFLVSSKNYGLLWDNYSITRFGDERDYYMLSAFKLKSADGKEGTLTASYYNDINADKPDLVRDEADLNIKYLDDIKKLPEAFNMDKGKVVWEGMISSPFEGEHRFRVYSSGYLKMWIDGELLQDNWRQGWNPWTAKHNLIIEKGKEYPFKIEWIPGSGQAFADITWIEALPEKERDQIRFTSEEGKQLVYYFVAGNSMDEVVSGYRTITGKAVMMPRWAMGLWQSRERYKTQEELLGVVKEFRKRKIPLDNIVLDWFYWPEDKWGDHNFDPARFPDPAAMLEELHGALNTQMMISVWPKFYVGTKNYEELNARGWIFPECVNDQQEDWVGYISSFYDAFNPDARKMYWDGMKEKLLVMGIDGWWMDATEPDILSNTSLEKRKKLMSPVYGGTPASLFNAYSLVHSGGVYNGLRKDDPDRRAFILTRSAFSGQQRYAAATWSGDVASRWDDLEAQISAGLNFSLAGIPFWTTDIGGFAVERRYEIGKGQDLDEWRELMTRWFQFGAFCPLFRVHGQFPYREMFNVAPETHPAYQSMLYYDKLRYRMLPYIYSLNGMVWLNDYTPMRSLVMDFSDDPACLDVNDQFMYGPALMIAPVYRFRERSRNVVLPAGCDWYDLNNGDYYEGGKSISARAPYTRLPLFAREGSILMLGPDLQYAAEKEADPLDVFVFTGKDATFTLYEDEGVNYNYEKGIFSTISFSWSEENQNLTIGKRSGEFPGMLKTRTFRVRFVSKAHPLMIDAPMTDPKIIEYSGDELVIK